MRRIPNRKLQPDMNKLLKGAVAGAAGIALLLGGAGTFAKWQSSANIGGSGTAITTGDLYLSNAHGSWADASGNTINNIVPGDTVIYTETVDVHGKGDHLTAGFAVNLGSLTQTAAAGGTAIPANFTVTGPVVSVPGGTAGWTTLTDTTATVTPRLFTSGFVTATIKVTVTFKDLAGNGNGIDDQDETLALPAGTVTLTQS